MDKQATLDAELAYVSELPGFKRTEPQYFRDPMIDRLIEVVMLLGGEFWVMRDRLFVLEHLLATHGRVTPDLIETFKDDEAVAKSLAEQRLDFVRRVFGRLYPDGTESKKDHFAWATGQPPGPKA